MLAYFVMQELETICLLMGDETDHLIGFLVRLFLLPLMRISASISVSSRCSYKRSLLFPTRHNSSHCSRALHRLPLSHLASCVHRRVRQQASEPPPLVIRYGRGAIRFLGSVLTRLLESCSSWLRTATSPTTSSLTTTSSPTSTTSSAT